MVWFGHTLFFSIGPVGLVVATLLLTSPRALCWSYDAASPASPPMWGRSNLGCSSSLAPWQSPVALEDADLAADSETAASCLITSVINSSEPLFSVPMILERMPSGLLMATPLAGRGDRGTQRFRQGLTVRISMVNSSSVSVEEANDHGSQVAAGDHYVLEAVAIHTGSEHASRFGAVGELQFILNPTDVSGEDAGSGKKPRTTVVSVPLVLSHTVSQRAPRLGSPARSFVSQLLREVRYLAQTATVRASSADSSTRSPSVVRADDGGPDARGEGNTATQSASVLDVAVSGIGGLSGSRPFSINTVPFLPVPVRTVALASHSAECHARSSACFSRKVSPLPTVSYSYEGTLTFPPCLPLPHGVAQFNTSFLKNMYSPNNTAVSLLPMSTDGGSVRISVPTVRHIVTPTYLVSQQTIDSIVLLTGGRSASVTEVTTAPAAGGLVLTSTTTHYVPIMTSRPAQRRSGRGIISALTYLPLFQDIGAPRAYNSELNVGPRSTIVLGAKASARSVTAEGLVLLPKSVSEHHVVLVRRRSANVRMETAIIVLSFLCVAVLCYIFLLILVRCDVVEIPTILGGKRLYVDFWTNPRSVLPVGFDALDADASESSDDNNALGTRRRAPRPRGGAATRRHRPRNWIQEDDSDLEADDRMLGALQSSVSSNRISSRAGGRTGASALASGAHVVLKSGRSDAPVQQTALRNKSANPLSMQTAHTNKIAFSARVTTMNKSPSRGGAVPIETNRHRFRSPGSPNGATNPFASGVRM